DLARYLGKITGATFAVTTGDGNHGIAVGLPAHFPKQEDSNRWANPKATEREAYLIRTHKNGAYLLGATEQGVEHAVWDFLDRLGYRQFFPGEHWEVIPHTPALTATIKAEESPSYQARRIWYGVGLWDYNAEPYKAWCARNRTAGGLDLHTGHSYGGIIRGLKAEFDAHPEFYPLIDGRRRPSPEAKLCIGNQELRRLVCEYEVNQVAKNPDLESVSLDPSDGGGWCECDLCEALGSISNRALLLANEVAAAVNAKYPGKYVGMYAYSYHSPPPTIRVDPNVIISVATAFLKGGLTLDEIISGWAKQGATLGIREYYSVNTWDRDQPGKARGGNLDYLARTIPAFHAQGARYLSAESSDNWGPNGLGYYLAARLLWDVNESAKINELTDDFLTRAFGPAKEPMAEFYRQLDGSKPHPIPDDQLGRMFLALKQARTLSADAPDVRTRINDLALYAHYVSLFQQYADAQGSARQEAFETLIRHTYRMRTTMLVHAKALYRDLPARDKTVKVPDGAAWNVPEGKNPWKSSSPFTEAEIAAWIKDGLTRHKPITVPFEPVAYSNDLLPAAGPLTLTANAKGADLGPGRGVQTFLTYVTKGPSEIELKITGGLIAHYRDRGHVKVGLWKLGGPSETGEAETLIAEDQGVPPDGKERTITLAVKEPGLYKLTVSDGGDMTRVRFPDDLPVVLPSTEAVPMNRISGRWTLSFYVPKGTKVVGLMGGGNGEVQDGDNRTRFSLTGKKTSIYAVNVPPGQDGQPWRIKSASGPLRLLTVPSYFAPDPNRLLLPAEVIKADRAKP
ncbi:MAG: DUF4838 domain-containing protein, partial [Isosphaeraceae bacterium]